MDIFLVLVSSDSSKDSVGTPAGRVILFGTIPTTIPDTTLSMTLPATHIDTTPIPTFSPTIPSSPDYTPASPDYSPASDTEFDPSEDPSSDHISPLPATSPFLSSTDDSSGSDIPYTPPSPTHDDSSSSSSSETSLDFLQMLYLILYPVVHLLIIHYQHHHRVRDLVIICVLWHRVLIVHLLISRDHLMILLLRVLLARGVDRLLSSPIPKALSYARTDLLPSPKRNSNLELTMDLEDCSEDSFEPYVPRAVRLGVDFEDKTTKPSRSRGTDLETDVDVERSNGIGIDPEIQEEIDECIAYADALRDRGIDARVIVETIDREEIKTKVTYKTLGDLVQRFYDHTEEILVYHVQAIEGVNEQSDRRMAEALRARDAVKNLGPFIRDGGEQEKVSGNEGNENGGNGNGGNVNGGNGNKGDGNEKYQVKYASCTLLNSALTWWNSYKRTIGIEATYAMSWIELMKLMTEVMVPNKEDKVERFVRGLPDNIQGNVIATEPIQLQDAIHIANNLIDQKLKGYGAENKRSNKCKIHHAGPCTMRCEKCKRVGHMTSDCKVTITSNNQRAPVGSQHGIICYECGRPGYFRKDCPKLRNQMRGNKTGNKNGN
uniref:CCHC-type domain-containing protein n=1 Tax=Tanacetum cinerariifolium TaxID=118510 RepID=A0A699I6D1_TANCI|nr:hypothetical protein [Tanacetum cinerariifolium]